MPSDPKKKTSTGMIDASTFIYPKKMRPSLIKKNFLFLLCLGIGLIAQCLNLLGLDPKKAITQYVQNVWKIEEGLPQNTVSAIVQTTDGHLWFGTEEGLALFDGVQFTVFDKRNTEEIKSNYVMALYEDRKGSLWIGTRSGGLNRLKDGKFASFTTKEGLSDDNVRSIYGDEEGNLWIGTRGGGLNLLKDGKFISFTTKEGLSSNNVSSIYADKDGSLWIGTYGGGLNRLKDGRFTPYTIEEGLSSNRVISIYKDREGSLWIGTDGGGLNKLKNGEFTIYTTKQGLSSNSIWSIYEDREGSLWIGTDGGGLNRLEGGKFAAYATKEGLSSSSVCSIYEDREGSLWIGTVGGGVDRLMDGKLTAFTTREGLSSDSVWSIYEDRKKDLWIGTDGGGLNRLREGKFTSFAKKEGLPNYVVRSIYEDGEGTLWVGTYGGGLNKLKDGKFTAFTTREGLSSDKVRSIYGDREGSLWIGTDGGGLNKLKNGEFTIYTTKEGLSSNYIWSIYEDKKGSLWIGTDGGGLDRLEGGKFITYTTREGLSNNLVLSIHEDREGTLWIGTGGGGLNRLKDGKFTIYTTKEGLFDDIVYTILEDDTEYFWMSGNKGIFRVSKKELSDFAERKAKSITSISYGRADGMQSSECNGGNQPAGWKGQDGKLWFPTMKGIVMIDPANLKINELPPPVIIEKVLVDDRPLDLNRRAQLSPGKNRFEFHYSGLSFLVPERVKFKYRLDGFDKDWIDADGHRTAYYTSIPPGHYRFKVIACNNDGIWNKDGASFSFFLKPYFYQTIPFYVLCGLFVIFLALGGFQVRIRQLRASEKRLTQLVEMRTAELERANQELERVSLTDKLTEIANRRSLDAFLDREWRRCAREGRPLSLIMVDIDFFKAYNDAYGHQAGDACLRQVAQVLKRNVNRAGDLAARYGGEEFMVILSETGKDGAVCVAEKLKSAVESLGIAHKTSTVAEHVTISLGCASVIPGRESEPSLLINAADAALYQSKRSGRNRMTILFSS
jgi:diguanylate cyclase (GGDEF)-like protein